MAVTLGALAVLALAVWRAAVLQRVRPPPRPPGQHGVPAAAALVRMDYRQVFTLLIFGSLSLLHAEAMVTTPLGFSLAIAIMLFLLLRAFEQLFLAEARQAHDYVDLSLSLLSATFYGWAAALNRIV